MNAIRLSVGHHGNVFVRQLRRRHNYNYNMQENFSVHFFTLFTLTNAFKYIFIFNLYILI